MAKITIESIYNLDDRRKYRDIIKENNSDMEQSNFFAENKVIPGNFNDFLYLKKKHLNYFNSKDYCQKLYGDEINEEQILEKADCYVEVTVKKYDLNTLNLKQIDDIVDERIKQIVKEDGKNAG